MHPRHPPSSERGAVAIIALWGMALVFILLAATSFTTRSEVTIAGNQVASSRARAAAEAGTQLGLYRLLKRSAAGLVLSDGTPEPWRDGTVEVTIAIIDENGKIDINQAPLDLLQGLFVAIGRPPAEALLLACNIVERRGGNLGGCPDTDTDREAPPRIRPFAAPEELADLPGFDDRLYGAIADYVTVATGASAIDPEVAPRAVLMAVPGASAELVDAFLTQRAMWHDIVSAGSTIGMLPATPYLTATPGHNFTIEAVATTAEGAHARADLQVRLSGLPDRPYRVIAWRTPAVRPPPPPLRRKAP